MPTSALTSEVKVATGLLKYHMTGTLLPNVRSIAAQPSITTWYEKKVLNVTKRWADARNRGRVYAWMAWLTAHLAAAAAAPQAAL
jgi:hypothetical protein